MIGWVLQLRTTPEQSLRRLSSLSGGGLATRFHKGGQIGGGGSLLFSKAWPVGNRGDNVPADELSNSVLHRFDMGMGFQVVPREILWRVLPELMAAGTELFQEIAEKRTQAKGSHK